MDLSYRVTIEFSSFIHVQTVKNKETYSHRFPLHYRRVEKWNTEIFTENINLNMSYATKIPIVMLVAPYHFKVRHGFPINFNNNVDQVLSYFLSIKIFWKTKPKRILGEIGLIFYICI